MSISKAWEWQKAQNSIWLMPSEESYYIAQYWKEKNVENILDLGCGLGRHSIYFAKQGFNVSAFDLSVDGVNYLKQWADNENLSIDIKVADMLDLPYKDNTFDAVFAYHVISHTDSAGIKQIIKEITRVLKVNGKLFITLCSKETWSFKDAGYPKLDENTIIKIENGPENGIPHFYVALDDIINILSNYNINKIRHTDDCYFDGKKLNSKHYFIMASLLNK